MTALVILHHTAITYGAIGGWFWHEILPSRSLSSQLLIFFCTTNQAYFMGFFFLLAAYYTPSSLERKGYGRFILDRFIRLGIPILAFGLVLGPLTDAMVTYARGKGFWPTFAWLWRHRQFEIGPLWFAEALLIFSLIYVLSQRVLGPQPGSAESRGVAPTPVPGFGPWFARAFLVGALALTIRQFLPISRSLFGYWAIYVVLFAVGIRARRRDWLAQLTWRHARPWIAIACAIWLVMPIAVLLAPPGTDFGTGLGWPAILYAFWEPFVAWGLIAAWLLVFRTRMNQTSAIWTWLNRRAYAVYIIHPVALVGISLLLRGWVAPALVKWGAVGVLACIACWLAADPLVRLPGLRRVV